jgi:hypothetical protein
MPNRLDMLKDLDLPRKHVRMRRPSFRIGAFHGIAVFANTTLGVTAAAQPGIAIAFFSKRRAPARRSACRYYHPLSARTVSPACCRLSADRMAAVVPSVSPVNSLPSMLTLPS